ncbi:prepilin peptidase [Roseimaritima ulvae]|uniref:prepilin peptidase n=1 Tax=Roseimaritima ulvae TaxID=980254 RepID=UPI0013905F6D|nr:A24 family peptidase [Roseimaritima ulvae]
MTGSVFSNEDYRLVWIDFIPVTLTAIAALVDLRTREIPDWIWVVILALVPLKAWWLWPDVALWQIPVGALAALLISGLVAWGDRFGGGDVKLFAALGAWFGITAVFPLALWCAIAGLPLAVVAAARGQTDYAYGPAILIGVAVHWMAPDLLGRIGGWA